MSQTHSRSSDSHRHSHTHGEAGERGGGARRALCIALGLTVGFSVVEAVGGWMAGSLALLSDAGHMVTDGAALGLALFAEAIARRPPSKRASYGYGRAEVLAAFVNAIAMLALVAAIAIEAVRRLLDPAPVAGGLLIGVALAGLAANLASAWVLSRATGSINTRGALLHVMGDLLGSLAALVAGGVILATGWMPIDPILSMAVAPADPALDVAAAEAVDGRADGRRAKPSRLRRDRPLAGRAAGRCRRARPAHLEHDVAKVSRSPRIFRSRAATTGSRSSRRRSGCLSADYGIRHATLQPTWPVARCRPRTIGA